MLNFPFSVMLLFLLILDEFSDDKFKICIFILLLRIAGIVELELLTSLKTILFQLTKIEWSFETLYFFFLLEVNIENRILIFSTVVCI